MYHLTEFKVHFRYIHECLGLSNYEIIKCVMLPCRNVEPFVANFLEVCTSADFAYPDIIPVTLKDRVFRGRTN